MSRVLPTMAALALAACRQATPAEVGTQSLRDAHPMATIQASQRAHEASPAVMAPAATGEAMHFAPQRR